MADLRHIKVTPAEEDDIVIIAGAVEPQLPSAEESAAVGSQEAAEEMAATEEGRAPSAESDPSLKEEGYRETTLDDLRSPGISGVQRAIIVVAIVAVAAFVIWYVLLR